MLSMVLQDGLKYHHSYLLTFNH